MSLEQLLPFLTTHMYTIVFLSAFFESILLTSFLLPGSVIVLLAAYLVGQQHGIIFPVFFFSCLGVLVGDVTNYILGKIPWQKWLPKNKWVKKLMKNEKTAFLYLKRFGLSIIIYTHLIGYFRSLICFAAGSAKMPLKKYLFAIAIASLIWGSIFVFTGYFLGLTGHDIKNINKQIQFFFLACFLVFVIFKVIESRMQTYLKNRLKKRSK